MMASSKLAVFMIVFSVACAVIYVISTELNLPLLTYHPAIGELDFLWTPERRGPAMYWYGWTVNCFIVGGIAGALATLLPDGAMRRIPLALTWILLLAGFPLMLYFMLPILTK